MKNTVGGWHCPCEAIDYEKLAREAGQECEALRRRIAQLKAQSPGSWDEELTLRRRIRMLTSMYYEQRSNRIFFEKRAKNRFG